MTREEKIKRLVGVFVPEQAVAPFEADHYIADGGQADGFTQGTS